MEDALPLLVCNKEMLVANQPQQVVLDEVDKELGNIRGLHRTPKINGLHKLVLRRDLVFEEVKSHVVDDVVKI